MNLQLVQQESVTYVTFSIFGLSNAFSFIEFIGASLCYYSKEVTRATFK
jgi:hypothetical protein